MAKEYVPIFFDWLEVTQDLQPEEKGNLIDAVVAYAAGKDYEQYLVGNVKIAFRFLKGQVDRNSAISESRSNARKNKTEETITNDNKTEQTETNFPKEKEKEKEKDNKKENKKEVVRFAPPSVEEVRAYCQERGNDVDPEAFVAFYESKGWKIGNTPMKSWKASVITWEKRERAAPTKTVIAQQYEQRDYSGVQEAVSNDYAGEIERRLKAKGQKKVIAQMYDQRDYSGVQDELMEQQDRDMEEYLRKEKEKGANNNAESNSTADVLPDDSEWLFNGTG